MSKFWIEEEKEREFNMRIVSFFLVWFSKIPIKIARSLAFQTWILGHDYNYGHGEWDLSEVIKSYVNMKKVLERIRPCCAQLMRPEQARLWTECRNGSKPVVIRVHFFPPLKIRNRDRNENSISIRAGCMF